MPPGPVLIPPPESVGGLRLGESRWLLWPHTLVRSSGFPLSGVAPLADRAVAEAADHAREPADPDYLRAWSESQARTGTAMAAVAASTRFRLAVAWQNRRFLDTAVDPLLRQAARGAAANRKRRAREKSVAAYWQRYCTKNDSIGFFGPVNWATVGATARTTATPGPGLVDRATVRLETWTVETLLRALDAELDLAAWTTPRRNPLLGRAARDAGAPAVALPDAILSTVDGKTTAIGLAERLGDGRNGRSVEAVLAELARLRDRHLLIWRPELAAAVVLEDDLRRFLLTVTDPSRREAGLDRLDALVRARDDVQAVWSDPTDLTAALAELDRQFTAVTGGDPVRKAGLAYAGRTLSYLECRRDVAVQVGTDVVDAMAPLALVLDSVRWLTAAIRSRFLPEVEAVFRRLERRSAEPPTVAELWVACLPLLGNRLPAIVTGTIQEMQHRWRAIIGGPTAAAELTLHSADLAGPVQEAFPAERSGWSEARWCCPDVMIAAADADQVREGVFSLVLGEVHPGTNSVDFASMVPHHPDRAALLRAVDHAFPGPRLLVAQPRESRPRLTARSHPALVREKDHRLLLSMHAPVPQTGRVRLATDVPVLDRAGRIVALLPGGDEFDILDVFAEAIKSTLVTGFDLFGRVTHPRVTVDRVVLARRTWTFAPTALAFASAAEESARFHGARRWARRHGLPRRVFVGSPLEPKPFYVDLDSPISVSLLAASIRRAGPSHGDDDDAIKIVEMLPDPGGTWLSDTAGEAYTAEFRFVAVDQPS